MAGNYMKFCSNKWKLMDKSDTYGKDTWDGAGGGPISTQVEAKNKFRKDNKV